MVHKRYLILDMIIRAIKTEYAETYLSEDTKLTKMCDGIMKYHSG